MIVILLLAIAANAYGDAYATGPSAQSQVAPASAAYGSPYSSNLNSAALQPQPIQVQPFSPFMQQSVPFEMQRAGVSAYPIGYGMFGPMQQGHHPYQMYSQQTLPNPFFVSYPQNMETYGAMRQSQQTSVPAVPSGASAYLTLPTSISSAPSEYSSRATQVSTAGGTTASLPGFTPPSVDPWAALGGVTTKKADNRKKKDGEGTFL